MVSPSTILDPNGPSQSPQPPHIWTTFVAQFALPLRRSGPQVLLAGCCRTAGYDLFYDAMIRPSSIPILPSLANSARRGSKTAYLTPTCRLNLLRSIFPPLLANIHRILSRGDWEGHVISASKIGDWRRSHSMLWSELEPRAIFRFYKIPIAWDIDKYMIQAMRKCFHTARETPARK